MRKMRSVALIAALSGSVSIAQQPPRTIEPAPVILPTSFNQVPQFVPTASVPLVPQMPALAAPTLAPPSVPAAATVSTPPLQENLRTFAPTTLDLSWVNNHWQLTAGGIPLKDFGRRESEGRLALRLVRSLGLNQYGTIGSPAPLMEYWLADGAPPHGPVPGFPVIGFDLATLHVEETLGQWCLRDSRRVLFNFGPRADDARQAYAVVRKYNFNQVAAVGQPAPAMLVFLAGPTAESDPVRSGQLQQAVASHESPEVSARKAQELQKLKEQFPSLGAETVAQPALRTLRTPDQPRQPFSANIREFGGEGLPATNPAMSARGSAGDDRVAFDWRRVQIRLDGNDWKLAADTLVFANFGHDQDAARRALDAVRYYRFSERHFVGRPTRLFSYFLVNGLAPRGTPFGVAGETFQPDALRVQQIEGKWALCLADRAVITLGESQEEAADLLQVIRRQKFDVVCRIGKPEDGFTFLARSW